MDAVDTVSPQLSLTAIPQQQNMLTEKNSQTVKTERTTADAPTIQRTFPTDLISN